MHKSHQSFRPVCPRQAPWSLHCVQLPHYSLDLLQPLFQMSVSGALVKFSERMQPQVCRQPQQRPAVLGRLVPDAPAQHVEGPVGCFAMGKCGTLTLHLP